MRMPNRVKNGSWRAAEVTGAESTGERLKIENGRLPAGLNKNALQFPGQPAGVAEIRTLQALAQRCPGLYQLRQICRQFLG